MTWSFSRSALIVAMLALPLALAGCGSPEERVAEYVEEGRQLLADGDPDRGAINFRNALRIEPNNADALLNMGHIHEQRENLARAMASYRDAASAAPEMIEAHAAYGVLALTAGRLEPVREAVEGIRAVDANHPDGLALAAALALRDDALDEAEDHAERALEREPSHVHALSALAGVANARGDTRRAVALIDERFSAHGVDVPLALLKIRLLVESGDLDGVEAAFEQAIAAAPDDFELRTALADFLQRQERPGAAEEVLRAASDRPGAPTAAMAALVRLVERNRGLDAALAEIDRLRREPAVEGHDLAFLAADMLSGAERFDEAEARLRAVLDATEADGPIALDARSGLATLARERGDLDTARSQGHPVDRQDGRFPAVFAAGT